jgi:hypothetical protein
MKNLVINESSRPVYLGMPSKRASNLNTIGSNIINTAKSTGGRIPCREKRQDQERAEEQEGKGTHRDDTDNSTRQFANPSEKDCSLAQSVDVGNNTNKGNCS